MDHLFAASMHIVKHSRSIIKQIRLKVAGPIRCLIVGEIIGFPGRVGIANDEAPVRWRIQLYYIVFCITSVKGSCYIELDEFMGVANDQLNDRIRIIIRFIDLRGGVLPPEICGVHIKNIGSCGRHEEN